MRHLIGTTMTSIVHDQGAISLLLLHYLLHFGISIARRGSLATIGIPHHLLYQIVRIMACYIICHIIGIGHVQVVIAIITHKHQGVLPCSGIGIGGIIDGFIYQYLGFCRCGNGESAHRHVLQFTLRMTASPLAQDAHPAITHIAIDGTEGVFALIAEQVIVWIQVSAILSQHPVVPYAVAEEQEILRHICLRSRLVGQHTEIAAIGVGIGRATGELIV